MESISNATSEHFMVASARQIVFENLSPKLKHQFAFRHFYTDELDPKASAVSTKFLSLVILYFCSIFRLEGRRHQYEERPSEKSGRDFAKAHKRAQSVFQHLSATYSVIVMRYSWHSIIEVPPRPRGALDRGNDQARARHGPRSSAIREPAFRYSSDEMVFFEVLYQVTADVVRIAFEGDATVQCLAVEQTNQLFRSKSFLFHSQLRSNKVNSLVKELDAKAKSVLENTQQLAELLVPAEEKLMVKFANQQRTPFLACQFPGGTSTLKYLRVRKEGVPSLPTKAEATYKVEMQQCPFQADHRAMASCNSLLKPTTRSKESTSPASLPPIADASLDNTQVSKAKGSKVTGIQDLVSRLSAQSPDVEATLLSATSQSHVSQPRRSPTAQTSGPAHQEVWDRTLKSMAGTLVLEEEQVEFERFLSRPAQEWASTDLYEEISAIYQALANGVVVSNFSVPLDMKLTYDLHGVLAPTAMWRDAGV